MALINKLNAIGDAIREKTGKTDLLTLEQMPIEIAAIETGGGGGDLPEEALLITGNCSYRFANGGWDWFINTFGKKIKTEGITNADYMFQNSNQLKEVPFDINISNGSAANIFLNAGITETPDIIGTVTGAGTAFSGCSQLVTYDCPSLVLGNNASISGLFKNCHALKNLNSPLKGGAVNYTSDLFYNCLNLREIPESFFEELEVAVGTGSRASIFQGCYSLRKVPKSVYKLLTTTTTTSTYSSPYMYLINSCSVLDELVDLGVNQTTWTSDMFRDTFDNAFRLKKVTFETNDDGTPIAVKWKSQVIDLSYYVGYVYSYYENRVTDYNSGITSAKKANYAEKYAELKNDSDWYTTEYDFSRYNHDSAVETINSLPDTSAYLATAGGTNTIKFKGTAGSKTDGGAINTLTEAEIAVAAAKGWTVTLV